nr:hypothetical protein CFP56_03255 [Quercus suber]
MGGSGEVQHRAVSKCTTSFGLQHPRTLVAKSTLKYIHCMREQNPLENIVQEEMPHSMPAVGITMSSG